MKEIIEKWKSYAEEDLKAAEDLFNMGYFRASCFYSHQAIEKILKAILIKYENKIIKTHDLKYLYKTLKKYIKKEVDKRYINFLNSIYIDSRYPTDLGLLPSGEPLKEDAEKALKYAKELFKVLKKEV